MEARVAVADAADAVEAEMAAASTPQQSGRKRPRANGSGCYRFVSRDLEEAAVKKQAMQVAVSSQLFRFIAIAAITVLKCERVCRILEAHRLRPSFALAGVACCLQLLAPAGCCTLLLICRFMSAVVY